MNDQVGRKLKLRACIENQSHLTPKLSPEFVERAQAVAEEVRARHLTGPTKASRRGLWVRAGSPS